MESIVLKYDRTAKMLHWVSAVVIIWVMLSGLFVSLLPSSALSQQAFLQELKHIIANFNVSLTILFIPLFIWRVFHAMKTKKPLYCKTLPTVQVKAACLVHLSMYILIATLLCSGLLMMNRPFGVFGLWSMAPIITEQTLLLFFAKVHEYSSYVLLAFIIIHLAALAKHQHSGNQILQRML
jgi:cytochrome b561